MIRPLEAIGYLWMAWLVGWVLASLTAAKSVVRQSGAGRLVHGLLVAADAILILGPHPRRPLRHHAPSDPFRPPLALLGTTITRDTHAGLLGLPFLFAGLFVKSKQEERLLLDRFGPEHEKYRAEVPALIPRI